MFKFVFVILLSLNAQFVYCENIDTELVESYLAGKLESKKNHWIYSKISEDKILFEIPAKEKRANIEKYYAISKEYLKNFKPMNTNVWNNLFGEFKKFPEQTTIFLIVGSPQPYDAFVRYAPDGKMAIIFDVNQILVYAKDKEEFIETMHNLITHELSHVLIKVKYPNLDEENPNLEKRLKNIAFNEGLAHFLSHEDLAKSNWDNAKFDEKKKNSFQDFAAAIKETNSAKHAELISKSNSGKYWDKFAAMAGMFTFADYWLSVKGDPQKFAKIFSDFELFEKEFAANLVKYGGK